MRAVQVEGKCDRNCTYFWKRLSRDGVLGAVGNVRVVGFVGRQLDSLRKACQELLSEVQPTADIVCSRRRPGAPGNSGVILHDASHTSQGEW
jgi:hypothetical protein